jgi:hypothetical protein
VFKGDLQSVGAYFGGIEEQEIVDAITELILLPHMASGFTAGQQVHLVGYVQFVILVIQVEVHLPTLPCYHGQLVISFARVVGDFGLRGRGGWLVVHIQEVVVGQGGEVVGQVVATGQVH